MLKYLIGNFFFAKKVNKLNNKLNSNLLYYCDSEVKLHTENVICKSELLLKVQHQVKTMCAKIYILRNIVQPLTCA